MPHAAIVSSMIAEGSGVGKRTELSVVNATENYTGIELAKLAAQSPTRISFSISLTDKKSWTWEAVLWRSNLFLDVPQRITAFASKEGFVALLEFAEEVLACKNVILAINKDRPDRAQAIRTFMFLGFRVLSPNHELVPPNLNNIYMICELND